MISSWRFSVFFPVVVVGGGGGEVVGGGVKEFSIKILLSTLFMHEWLVAHQGDDIK